MKQPAQANVASTVVGSDTFAEMSETGTADVRLGRRDKRVRKQHLEAGLTVFH